MSCATELKYSIWIKTVINNVEPAFKTLLGVKMSYVFPLLSKDEFLIQLWVFFLYILIHAYNNMQNLLHDELKQLSAGFIRKDEMERQGTVWSSWANVPLFTSCGFYLEQNIKTSLLTDIHLLIWLVGVGEFSCLATWNQLHIITLS